MKLPIAPQILLFLIFATLSGVLLGMGDFKTRTEHHAAYGNQAEQFLVPQTDPEMPAKEEITSSREVDPKREEKEEKEFAMPITDASNRVTKKPFGIKITAKSSPVQPERFSGYHTGVDFETYSAEENESVPVYAVCMGELAVRKRAAGYGGVAVQRCKLNKEDIIIIYGHVKLESITARVGQILTAGEQIGILGKGYGAETDGERKHLHLAIHKGKEINILGYVQNEKQLGGWIDIMEYLK